MKLLETLLYIALFAFLLSGYVLFAQNLAHYLQVTSIEKKYIEKERLLHEYLRWNIGHATNIITPNDTIKDTSTSTKLILQKENGEVMTVDNGTLKKFAQIKNLVFYIEDKHLVVNFNFVDEYAVKNKLRELEILLTQYSI